MTSVTDRINAAVRHMLAANGYPSARLSGFTSVGGGCINNGGRVQTSSGDFFLKWNSRSKYPDMFSTEARGLTLLSATHALVVPKVVAVHEDEEMQYLLLEFVESGPRNVTYWERLGEGLATMHRNSAGQFGLDHDNYIGSLTQYNSVSASWVDFFIQQRLQKQLELLESKGLAGGLRKRFERLYPKLASLLKEGNPSLLHGDLWSGNVIVSAEGDPCIIDPAVYFGHREVDIAMTRLFGGFASRFYDAYVETWPLEPGYEERLEIYNLYPLLVHANLFGVSYVHQIADTLDRFV